MIESRPSPPGHQIRFDISGLGVVGPTSLLPLWALHEIVEDCFLGVAQGLGYADIGLHGQVCEKKSGEVSGSVWGGDGLPHSLAEVYN